MKFISNKSALNYAINIAQKAIATKATLEILEYVLVMSDETGLKLRSNNFQISIEATVEDAKIEKHGAVCLEAKIFGDIIKNLPDGDVEIEVLENFETVIKASKSKFKIKGLDGKDFPNMRTLNDGVVFALDVEEYNDMIKKTSFSVAKDDAKPVITGELFNVKNKKINVVSLDGFRISHIFRDIDTEGEFEVVIPGIALNEVSKILNQNTDEKLQVMIADDYIEFKTDRFRLITSLINGDFFKYETMFVDTYTTKITLSRQELEQALRRTIIVANEKNMRNPVIFNIKDENIAITSNGNIADFYEEVACEKDGENLKIGFNPKFILDALVVMDDDTIEISFNNQFNPCIIRGVEYKNCEYIVLPLRIEDKDL